MRMAQQAKQVEEMKRQMEDAQRVNKVETIIRFLSLVCLQPTQTYHSITRFCKKAAGRIPNLVYRLLNGTNIYYIIIVYTIYYIL